MSTNENKLLQVPFSVIDGLHEFTLAGNTDVSLKYIPAGKGRRMLRDAFGEPSVSGIMDKTTFEYVFESQVMPGSYHRIYDYCGCISVGYAVPDEIWSVPDVQREAFATDATTLLETAFGKGVSRAIIDA
jgi:hypothetical protein